MVNSKVVALPECAAIKDSVIWVPVLFQDKRIKFNFGWDNGIKFNISARIRDKK